MTKNVLFVLTSHHALGETGKPTGFHLFEAAAPWSILTDAGFKIDFASPKGGHAPIDPGSMDREPEANRRLLDEGREHINNTLALEHVDASRYDGVYLPGGHGAMWDLPGNKALQQIIRTVHEDNNGVVAAVCHGPAAFVGLKLSDGRYLVEGRHIACFSDLEEMAVGRDKVVPFLLAGRLREQGAIHEMADNFGECVRSDGRLVTGQNPASVVRLGKEFRDALNATGPAARPRRGASRGESRPGA